jgi:hypothetical protein
LKSALLSLDIDSWSFDLTRHRHDRADTTLKMGITPDEIDFFALLIAFTFSTLVLAQATADLVLLSGKSRL